MSHWPQKPMMFVKKKKKNCSRAKGAKKKKIVLYLANQLNLERKKKRIKD